MKTFNELFNSIVNEELALHKINLKPHTIGSASDKEIEMSSYNEFKTGKDWIEHIRNKFPKAHIEYVKDDTMMLSKDAPYMLKAMHNGKVVAKYRGTGMLGRPDMTNLNEETSFVPQQQMKFIHIDLYEQSGSIITEQDFNEYKRGCRSRKKKGLVVYSCEEYIVLAINC
jgi:hypothetical protein